MLIFLVCHDPYIQLLVNNTILEQDLTTTFTDLDQHLDSQCDTVYIIPKNIFKLDSQTLFVLILFYRLTIDSDAYLSPLHTHIPRCDLPAENLLVFMMKPLHLAMN